MKRPWWTGSGDDPNAKRKQQPGRRSADGSCFGSCPLCQQVFPIRTLESHAAQCNGPAPPQEQPSERQPHQSSEQKDSLSGWTTTTVSPASLFSPTPQAAVSCSDGSSTASSSIPGLYIYENFITEEDEARILAYLDGTLGDESFVPWTPATFNGKFSGKRWGVHCNLRDKRVTAAERPLPDFVQSLILPKLAALAPMAGIHPNEANAIDYRRDMGHYLKSHVDDRQLSKEPIANLSLAGDCYMTFTNVSPRRNTSVMQSKVLLKRRTLQILTGAARYDYSHGIEHSDLLSARRVSVTMRESPLTHRGPSTKGIATTNAVAPRVNPPARATASWWNPAGVPSLHHSRPTLRPTTSTVEPIPGLLVFQDFVTTEEEGRILYELDHDTQSWKLECHTGRFREKRFGVDSDLWSRTLKAPQRPMPEFVNAVLLPKLRCIPVMAGVTPNEGNAIEYRRQDGDWLKAHVDDRRKHKEPIANLSLAGTCYMTFQPASSTSGGRRGGGSGGENDGIVRVLLQPRTLVILTGEARYGYTHGIDPRDVLSERRVSFTMRETA